MTALDHLRRLQDSPLYQQREIDGAQAHQLARVRALWYLDPAYVAKWPEREAK